MKFVLVVCVLMVYIGAVFGGEEEACECRLGKCLEGDKNDDTCSLGYAIGKLCCWEVESDCQCKEFCNTDERRHRTCGIKGDYGYCCKFPRRYN